MIDEEAKRSRCDDDVLKIAKELLAMMTMAMAAMAMIPCDDDDRSVGASVLVVTNDPMALAKVSWRPTWSKCSGTAAMPFAAGIPSAKLGCAIL